MLKVLDVFNVGDMVSVTLDGNCAQIANGSKLIDENGNDVVVLSVAMTRHENPHDISKSTTILVAPCNLRIGSSLSIA